MTFLPALNQFIIPTLRFSSLLTARSQHIKQNLGIFSQLGTQEEDPIAIEEESISRVDELSVFLEGFEERWCGFFNVYSHNS